MNQFSFNITHDSEDDLFGMGQPDSEPIWNCEVSFADTGYGSSTFQPNKQIISNQKQLKK